MKTKQNLVVYYSRTGTSEVLAKILREKLACDMDKIDYEMSRGKVSFVAASWEAVRKAKKGIKGDIHKPEEYDRVFFISPVWANGLATPIRSYMAAHKDKIDSYSLIITGNGTTLEKVQKDARAVMKCAPEAAAEFKTEDIHQGKYDLSKLFGQYQEDIPPGEEK